MGIFWFPLWLPFAVILGLLVFGVIDTWWGLVVTLIVVTLICLADWSGVGKK